MEYIYSDVGDRYDGCSHLFTAKISKIFYTCEINLQNFYNNNSKKLSYLSPTPEYIYWWDILLYL